MKILFEYKSDQEKQDILSTIGLTVQPVTEDLELAEKALKEALQRVLGEIYIKGSVAKVARENQEQYIDKVRGFFKE